jgi:hypothetical protein
MHGARRATRSPRDSDAGKTSGSKNNNHPLRENSCSVTEIGQIRMIASVCCASF